MQKAIVFVSSTIQEPENFVQERLKAKTVIEAFPCFESWIFEKEGASSEALEASYLGPLRDAFGVPKPSQPGEQRSVQVQELLRGMHHIGEWRHESDATHGNQQVVYDGDGYYFRAKANDRRFPDQILVMRNP